MNEWINEWKWMMNDIVNERENTKENLMPLNWELKTIIWNIHIL